MTSIIVQELWLATSPNRAPPEFNVTTGVTDHPLGAFRIVVNTQDVGRLEKPTSATEAQEWAMFVRSAFESPEVKDCFHKVATQHAIAEGKLRDFSDAMRGLIQKIDNGVPIEGECTIEPYL